MSTGATINEFSTDATLADDSDTALPTEKAVKTYVDGVTANMVTSINDLSDGKSDADGTEDGSSLFLGVGSGASDDSTNNRNVGVGYQVLNSNTTGNWNTANGYQALFSNTEGSFNVANGGGALESNIEGEANVANGSLALQSNTEGDANVANGSAALRSNNIGSNNVANGTRTLNSNTTGSNNVAVGNGALISNTTGNGNVALGFNAGFFETGSNKLYIGNSGTSSPLIYGEFDNRLLILNGVTTVNNSSILNPDLILGGQSNSASGDNGIISSDPDYNSSDIFIKSYDAVVVQLDFDNNETGEFEIRNGSQGKVFEVSESGNVRVNGSLVHSSDRRLKKDITDLPYGLKEILQLQPKAYNWKRRETDHKSLGLIAQDVQTLIKEIVTTQDNDAKTLGISYTELIPILINAIKEQQVQLEGLQIDSHNKDTVLAEVLKRLDTLENSAVMVEKELVVNNQNN